MSGKHYVLCFAFGQPRKYTENVATPGGGVCIDLAMHLKSTGPATAHGWNVFGGEVEPTESVVQAVAREFHEEAGLRIPLEYWTCFDSRWFHNGNLLTSFVTQVGPHDLGELNKRTDKGEPIGVKRFTLHLGDFPSLRINSPTTQQFARSMAYLLPMAVNHLFYPDHRPDVQPLIFDR